MGLGIRVVMFVLVTVLLDVPRWLIESGIVGAEGGEEGNGVGNGCLNEGLEDSQVESVLVR